MTKWVDVGYLKLSKNKKRLYFKIKNQTYIVHREEWEKAKRGEIPFALIYEAVEE